MKTNAKPTLMHADFRITVDGGDIRQPAVMEAYEAAVAALMVKAEEHGLTVCVSRRLRSSPPRSMRLNLRKLGFRLPLEVATPVSAGATASAVGAPESAPRHSSSPTNGDRS